jgi:AraC family transcriptional regulator
MLKGLGLELLTLTARASKGPPEFRPVWLNRAKDYLHENFADNLSIDELALAVGVHPGHLMRCFRREYGCTIGDYVRKLRIDYASLMLLRAESSLSSIATSSGFSDQSHFIRTFKAATGLTPSAFQRTHRKG